MNATRTLTYTESVTMITEQCCNCGVLFAMTDYFVSERRTDEKWFYCPNGHPQQYSPSEATKLKDKLRKQEIELEQKQREVDAANSARDSFRAAAEREKKAHQKTQTRIGNGVCPCCNRSFVKLAAHMRSKHKEFVQDHQGELPK